MIYDLPKSVEFGGREWDIRTDYRDILNILLAFDDPDLSNEEKVYVCLQNMYPDFEQISPALYQDAYNAAIHFIDHGSDDKRPSKRTMDWEQDAPILFPAVNHVAGYEVRSVEYLHWWTFMGFFMEIKDSTFATVLSLRAKKNKGKKLEKYEQDFWKDNLNICVLKHKESAEAIQEKERLKALLGG